MTTQPGTGTKPTSLVDLRAAVRGPSPKLNRLEALEQLVDRSPRGLAGFLTEVALDPKAELDVRVSAVGALGTSGEPTAVDGLVAALSTADQAVVRRAAQRLGVIGGRSQLEELKAIRTGNPATQQAVRFAKQLISYRHRLGQYRVSIPGGRVRPGPGTATKIAVTPLSGKFVADIEKRITEPLLGLQLTTKGARKLTCNGDDLAVLPSRDLVNAGPGWLLKGQAAPAAILERNPETGEFFASHVVFTDPGSGMNLGVHVARSSGVVVLSGRGMIRGDQVTFELATIPTPHLPPTTVVGQFNRSTGLAFDNVLTQLQLSPGQLKMVRAPSRQAGPV